MSMSMSMSMSNRPAPRPYCPAEEYKKLTGHRDTIKRILEEMDPSNPLHRRAIDRMLIAENMITDHLIRGLNGLTRRTLQTGSSTLPTTPVPSAKEVNIRNEPTSSGLTPPK